MSKTVVNLADREKTLALLKQLYGRSDNDQNKATPGKTGTTDADTLVENTVPGMAGSPDHDRQ